MPPKTLTSYLVEISDDPVKLREFYEDRPRALRGSGLKAEHRKALLEDDLTVITDEVHKESGKAVSWRMAPINKPALD